MPMRRRRHDRHELTVESDFVQLEVSRRRFVERDRAIVVIAVVALLVAIHLSYEFLVAPLYTYMRLSYTAPDLPIYAAMLALIIGMSFLMPMRMARLSDFVLWALFVLVVVPSLTISYLARSLPDGTQLMLGLIVTICFSTAILAGRVEPRKLGARVPRLSARAFWIGVSVLSGLTYVSLVASGSFRLSLPGLGEVYTVRTAFDAANSANRLLAYLLPNQANVINPMLMAIGVVKRRSLLIVAGAVGELILYGAAGHKSVLFAIPAVIVVALVFRGRRPPAAALVPAGFTAVILGSAAVDAFLGTPWLTSLFTRRFIDVPGLLTGAWVSVFSHDPQVHFSYSFLSPFLHYPYQIGPPYVVAEHYFGVASMNANANLFADGYANFGWAGMAFESAILIAILLLANAFSRRVPLQAAAMVFVMPVVALSNTSVLTSLFTHGVVLALLILMLAPAEVWARVPATAPAALVTTTLISAGAVSTTDGRTAAPAQVSAGGSVGVPEALRQGENQPLEDHAPGRSWWQRSKALQLPR